MKHFMEGGIRLRSPSHHAPALYTSLRSCEKHGTPCSRKLSGFFRPAHTLNAHHARLPSLLGRARMRASNPSIATKWTGIRSHSRVRPARTRATPRNHPHCTSRAMTLPHRSRTDGSFSNPPIDGIHKKHFPYREGFFMYGGEGGIRTPGTVTRSQV